MTKDTNPDEIVNKLFAKLQEKKKVLEGLENPSYKTNLSFGYTPETSTRVNIHTVTDVNVLVGMAAFLLERSKANVEAAKLLEVKSEFKWQGYSLEDWLHDLKTRANKINIDAKRKEYKTLEEKLNGLVSPEQRRILELEAIAKSLEV